MRDIYFCTNCKATLDYQTGFSPSNGWHVCTRCGAHLAGPDGYKGERFEDVLWYCDSCGAYLNNQENFTDLEDHWDCTVCGHRNPISEEEIHESNYRKREPGLIKALNAINFMLDKELDRRVRQQQAVEEYSQEDESSKQDDEIVLLFEKIGMAIFKGFGWIFKSLAKVVFIVIKFLFTKAVICHKRKQEKKKQKEKKGGYPPRRPWKT